MSEEEKQERQETGKGGNNKALIVVSVLSVVIIASLGAALYLSSSRKAETVIVESSEAQTRPVVVNEENVESVAEEFFGNTQTDVPLSYIVMMNSTWDFEDGQSASKNAYVENSDENETAVYFDVIRKDTGETIYQSPVIPLGGHLENIKLDEALDAGEYECTLIYHLIDDEQNTLTTVNMWLMIRIEN